MNTRASNSDGEKTIEHVIFNVGVSFSGITETKCFNTENIHSYIGYVNYDDSAQGVLPLTVETSHTLFFPNKEEQADDGQQNQGQINREDLEAKILKQIDDRRKTEDNQVYRALLDAISTLPKGQAVVAYLRLIEGLGNKEIADSVGICEGSAGCQYHFAKKKISDHVNLHAPSLLEGIERIMHNSRKRHPKENKEELVSYDSKAQESGDYSELYLKKAYTALEEAVRTLPLKYSKVARLRLLDGLSMDEAGAELDLSPSQISLMFNYAKKRIMAYLRKVEPEIALYVSTVLETEFSFMHKNNIRKKRRPASRKSAYDLAREDTDKDSNGVQLAFLEGLANIPAKNDYVKMPANLEDLSDQELVRLMPLVDPKAFPHPLQVIEARYHNMMQRMITGILHTSDVDDICQIVMLKLYNALIHNSFKQESELSTYVFSIARNAAISALRQRRLEMPFSSIVANEEKGETSSFNIPTKEYVPDIDVEEERKQTQELLYKAVERLPGKYAKLINLQLQGLSYEEIASIQGIKDGTVKSRLHRAHKLLEDRIREEEIAYNKDRASSRLRYAS